MSEQAAPLVLIVEDEPLVRWSLVTRLRNDGYRVEGVDSGEEALTYCDAHEVDLIVLDVNLTTMTGLEVLERLREKGRGNLPAIVVTAFQDEALVRSCDGLGVFAIMDKPFSLEDFSAAVARAIDSRARG
ncbi:MAG: response regulator [Candidatus Dadabacteria bacterium]|nr:MAG: response regulator [Candidatus Dadabacteria bacterium]